MKFDHLLKIYWTRYFLYGGTTFPFHLSLYHLWRALGGFGFKALNALEKKHEQGPLRLWWRKSYGSEKLVSKRPLLNSLFAKMINVNGGIREWEYQNQLRLYLIKSYRGRSLALGKPSHGQRTWSNANTSKKKKSLFKSFISVLRGEQARKAAALAKRSFQYRMKMQLKAGKRRVKRRSNRQKRMQLKIEPTRLWF